MKSNYIPQLEKLAIGSGGGFWVFDPKYMVHHPWNFAEIDIEKMKGAGIQWVIEICSNYGLHNTEEPWFDISWIIRKQLQVNQREYVFPSLDEMSSQEKENTWNAYVWFIKSMYVTPRYVQRQELLWQDMIKDYEFFKKFFKEYSDLHIGLLMHHMASMIGFALGNSAGD